MKNSVVNDSTILFEDDHLIIVDKPSGLLVHPYKKETNELESLMKYVRNYSKKYVFAVNRIDRPVSGIVVFSKQRDLVKIIKDSWSSEQTIKEYITLVRREINDEGEFNFPLSNEAKVKQPARTVYFPIKVFDGFTLMKVRIFTGRKHQIRRHFSRRCFNIIGDTKYGKGKENNYFRENFNLLRIFLHGHKLQMIHPVTNEVIKICCPLHPDLINTLKGMNYIFEETCF